MLNKPKYLDPQVTVCRALAQAASETFAAWNNELRRKLRYHTADEFNQTTQYDANYFRLSTIVVDKLARAKVAGAPVDDALGAAIAQLKANCPANDSHDHMLAMCISAQIKAQVHQLVEQFITRVRETCGKNKEWETDVRRHFADLAMCKLVNTRHHQTAWLLEGQWGIVLPEWAQFTHTTPRLASWTPDEGRVGRSVQLRLSPEQNEKLLKLSSRDKSRQAWIIRQIEESTL